MPLVASRLSTVHPSSGLVRRLTDADRPALLAHFRRLGAESRRMRFGGIVGDTFLETYAAKAIGPDALVKGLFAEGTLRGVAELRFLGPDGASAEAAFSLEDPWQGQGQGTRLFSSLLDGARNRGVGRMILQCLRENAAMQAIARRHEAELAFHQGEVVAEIRHPVADAGTRRREADEERNAEVAVAADRGLERLAAQAGVDRRVREALP